MSEAKKKERALRVWIGLAGAPVVWIAQMSLSFSTVSHACYPHNAPLPQPLWPHVPGLIMVLNLFCLLAGLACSWVAVNEWRESQQQGTSERVIESGESRGGFLVMLSAISSLIFVISIVFTSLAIFLVAPCGPW
jgi:hypothetical protein